MQPTTTSHHTPRKRPPMRRGSLLGVKGPVLCVHCGKGLTAAGGYGGHYYFLLVQDAQGNRGKVHGDCWVPLDHSKWALVPKTTTK